MKYVVIDKNFCEVPIIFPDVINHVDVVKDGTKVISAGEVSIQSSVRENGASFIRISCWGQSIDLKKKSRPDEDASLIENAILRH